MASVLLIVAQKNFRDEELFETKEELEAKNHVCTVASITTDTARGMFGATADPDIAVKDASVDDYDAIVLVGGSGSPELANHKEVLDLLVEAKRKNKLLAAICLAPMVLAKAGVITGKKATVFKTHESLQTLAKNGVDFVDKGLVTDTLLVTGNGPDAAREFGKKIAEMLK